MNNEEKMLIKQENKSIFEKAFEFIKKLFSPKKEETNFKSNTSHKKNNSFTEQFENSKKLFIIQKNFENGTIKERDLTLEERNALVNLYKSQIEHLQRDIDIERRILQNYKAKILSAQNRLNSRR